jgi:hypothetical protein
VPSERLGRFKDVVVDIKRRAQGQNHETHCLASDAGSVNCSAAPCRILPQLKVCTEVSTAGKPAICNALRCALWLEVFLNFARFGPCSQSSHQLRPFPLAIAVRLPNP